LTQEAAEFIHFEGIILARVTFFAVVVGCGVVVVMVVVG
jgi:hypothetical protein